MDNINYNTLFIITGILSIIYSIILSIEFFKKPTENNKKSIRKQKNELKNWEFFSKIFVYLLIFIVFIFLIFKFQKFLSIFSFIYYSFLFGVYISTLINILITRNDKLIDDNELTHLVSIPFVFFVLYNTSLSQYFITFLKNLVESSLVFFIIKSIIKYFIPIFFISIIIFLIMFKLKNIIKIKKEKCKKDYSILLSDYNFKNSKKQQGIRFLIFYIIDIFILIKYILLALIEKIFIIPIYYISNILLKCLKILTNNFSLSTIIIKTFNISLIISLLLTYNILLNQYKESNIINVYSIIITSVIIPIILNTINDLKKNYLENKK